MFKMHKAQNYPYPVQYRSYLVGVTSWMAISPQHLHVSASKD